MGTRIDTTSATTICPPEFQSTLDDEVAEVYLACDLRLHKTTGQRSD